jgi:hypothetical protein
MGEWRPEVTEDTTMSDTHGSGEHAAQVPDAHGTSHAVEGAHGSTEDHGDGHGHDDHGHVSEALGPIDWTMWGVGVLGVVAALAVVWALVLGTGFSFSA